MGWPLYGADAHLRGKILKGGPGTLGFLMGAVGMGALDLRRYRSRCARPCLAWTDDSLCRGAVGRRADSVLDVASAMAVDGADVFTGFGLMQVDDDLQHDDSDHRARGEKRGRAMSYYTMAFVGMAPFGSLLAGAWRTGSARRGR